MYKPKSMKKYFINVESIIKSNLHFPSGMHSSQSIIDTNPDMKNKPRDLLIYGIKWEEENI